MADGTTKPIEDIRAGDKVIATDPATGKTTARQVLAPITSKGVKNLVRVTVGSGDEAGVLTATGEHPFWVPAIRQWQQAYTLWPGQYLRTGEGTYVQISAINARTTADQRVHNLTVAGTHTYYVLAGATPVLVHNSGDDPRFNYLDRPGFSNYTLADASEKVYYSGMFGGNETAASVIRRHSKNNNRFNARNGDSIAVAPGTRTYGEACLMEQRLAEQYNTIIGRSGKDYRGNRQNPLDGKKLAEYKRYERKKRLGGC